MTKSEKYLNATSMFVAHASERPTVAKELRSWVDGQAKAARDVCPSGRLRCFAKIYGQGEGPPMISVELAAPSGRYHSVLIHCDNRHEVAGRTPHVADVAAGMRLLTLLTDELKTPVWLQP